LQNSSKSPKKTLAFLPSFFVFLLIQCFFLRYFIGIGNPTSLLTLVFVVSLSMYAAFEACLERVPGNAPRASKALSALVRVRT
jgi:hypothetical protein